MLKSINLCNILVIGEKNVDPLLCLSTAHGAKGVDGHASRRSGYRQRREDQLVRVPQAVENCEYELDQCHAKR